MHLSRIQLPQLHDQINDPISLALASTASKNSMNYYVTRSRFLWSRKKISCTLFLLIKMILWWYNILMTFYVVSQLLMLSSYSWNRRHMGQAADKQHNCRLDRRSMTAFYGKFLCTYFEIQIHVHLLLLKKEVLDKLYHNGFQIIVLNVIIAL